MHLTALVELLEQEVGATESSRTTLAEILAESERRQSAPRGRRTAQKTKKRASRR